MQLIFYSDDIEEVVKSTELINQNPFEVIVYKDQQGNNNPKYYSFIKGWELILKILRYDINSFSEEFKSYVYKNLFPKLKNEFGYSSELNLFYGAFHLELLEEDPVNIMNLPNILEKLIAIASERFKSLYPQMISEKLYGLSYGLILKEPDLLSIYKTETEILLKNITLNPSQYTDLIQILDKFGGNYIQILESNRKQKKEEFYDKLIQSPMDGIDLEWFHQRFQNFRFTLDLFSDDEFAEIIKKLIGSKIGYSYENHKAIWIHLILLEISYSGKAELLKGYLNELVELDHLQVVQSYFRQFPERIKASQNLIINKLRGFNIDLLQRHYSAFDISDPVKFFKIILEKSKGEISKIILIFFAQNEELILEFKNAILSCIQDIVKSEENAPLQSNYYEIMSLFDYVYEYRPEQTPEVDLKLIEGFYKKILSIPSIAKEFYPSYRFHLREYFSLFGPDLQKKIVSQLIKNECMYCIEFLLVKNLDIMIQDIDLLLSYSPEKTSNPEYHLLPLEFILRKKYKESEIRDKILDRLEELGPSQRKAQLYLFLGNYDLALLAWKELLENEEIIPNLINIYLDYKMVGLEIILNRNQGILIEEECKELTEIETTFNYLRIQKDKQYKFQIKINTLKARLNLFKGFNLLKEYDFDNSKIIFQRTSKLYSELTNLQLGTDFKVSNKIFNVYSGLSQFFEQKIHLFKRHLETGDINRANLLIEEYISTLRQNETITNPQIESLYLNLNDLKFDLSSHQITQMKGVVPSNYCSEPPKVLSKKLLDEKRKSIIEWDKNNTPIGLASLALSKKEEDDIYYLEIRFADKNRSYEFQPKIKYDSIFIECGIEVNEEKSGMIRFKINLKPKPFDKFKFLIVTLTEENICGFQILINIPIIYNEFLLDRDRENFLDKEYANFNDLFAAYPGTIRDLEKRFREYQHIEGKKIDSRAIKNWLKQFETPNRARLALSLLDKVQFFYRHRITTIMKELYEKSIRGVKVIIAPLGSPFDSSGSLDYFLADFLMEEGVKATELRAIIENRDPNEYGILFCDDIIQSGGQAITIFQQLFGCEETNLDEAHELPLIYEQKLKLKEFKLFFLYIFGHLDGIKKLKESLSSMGFPEVNVFSSFNNEKSLGFTDTLNSMKAQIFNDPTDLEEAKTMCEEIGYQLFSDKPWDDEKKKINSLGYGNKQGLIVFDKNVPTITLPILWERGTYNGKQWEPLFLRRPKR